MTQPLASLTAGQSFKEHSMISWKAPQIAVFVACLFILHTTSPSYADEGAGKVARAKSHAEYIQKHGMKKAWPKEEAREKDVEWLKHHPNKAKHYVKNNPKKVLRHVPHKRK